MTESSLSLEACREREGFGIDCWAGDDMKPSAVPERSMTSIPERSI